MVERRVVYKQCRSFGVGTYKRNTRRVRQCRNLELSLPLSECWSLVRLELRIVDFRKLVMACHGIWSNAAPSKITNTIRTYCSPARDLLVVRRC